MKKKNKITQALAFVFVTSLLLTSIVKASSGQSYFQSKSKNSTQQQISMFMRNANQYCSSKNRNFKNCMETISAREVEYLFSKNIALNNQKSCAPKDMGCAYMFAPRCCPGLVCEIQPWGYGLCK